MYKCLHSPAYVKLSVSFSPVPLRHVTVVSVLVIVLDTVTLKSRSEVNIHVGDNINTAESSSKWISMQDISRWIPCCESGSLSNDEWAAPFQRT